MRAMQQLLMIEDDARLAQMVGEYLEKSGFAVAKAADAKAGLDLLQDTGTSQLPDLVVLDLMLPDVDGLEVCRRIRAMPGEAGRVPVLMLTAKGDPMDRIVGLEIGADDYLPKPYVPRELLARVRAILRRTREVHRVAAAPPGEVYGFAGWRLDSASRDLLDAAGAPVVLTGGEHDLLMAFLRHAQRVLSRDQLLDWTRGRSATPYDRSIDVLLGRLRRKLASGAGGEGLIKTVRGGGYLFSAPVERL